MERPRDTRYVLPRDLKFDIAFSLFGMACLVLIGGAFVVRSALGMIAMLVQRVCCIMVRIVFVFLGLFGLLRAALVAVCSRAGWQRKFE